MTICYALDGAAVGLLFYVAFVLSRGFSASALLVALAAMCMPAGYFFSYPVGYFFEGRPKNALFLTAAIVALVSATGFALFPAENGFTVFGVTFPPGSAIVVWMMLYAIGEAIKFPARFSVIQTNFSYRERSKFLGVLFIFYAMLNLMLMFFAGLLLDSDSGWYRILLPGAMVISAISSLTFYFLPAKPLPGKSIHPFGFKHLLDPVKNLYSMAFREKYFMGFELGYFLYGMGYMTVGATLPFYYTSELGAKYGQFGITGIILNLAMLLSPIVGKWADRSTPTKLAAIAFFMNTLFPIALLFCDTPIQAYFAHAWFASAVIIDVMAWNMGPIFFSGSRDASTYVGINASLTGVRAIIAFIGSGLLLQLTGSFTLVLGLAAALFLAGGITMVIVHQACKRHSKYASTASGRFNYVG
jgi:hypothetical protein